MGYSEEVGCRAPVVHARGLGPQIIPVFQATVAPAEPGQGDEIDLFVFAHGFDKRHEFLVDRIIRPILQHLDHAVVGRIGSILVRTRVGVLDVEFTRFQHHKADLFCRNRQRRNRIGHVCTSAAPRLGEFPEMKRRTRILVPSRELTLLNCDAPMLDRRQGHRRAIGLSGPTRTQRRGSSIVSRTAPPWRPAAQGELRHRLTLGQFAPDNPTPEQLLDMALQRVWHERRRLSSTLGIKAFALASIFRTAEALAAREDERSRTTTELFPEEVEPDPVYENDDDFWQSHELEYPKNSQVFSGTVDRAQEDVAEEDEFVGWLAPRERGVLLMPEVHGVPWQEVALALGITPAEAEGLLASARRRVRAADKAAH